MDTSLTNAAASHRDTGADVRVAVADGTVGKPPGVVVAGVALAVPDSAAANV